jgi:hypothetical protein
MTRRATFTKAELSRAVRGLTEAGVGVVRIDIEPSGKIVIITGTVQETNNKLVNEWDAVK